jgi:hypothetical protein
VYVVQSRRPRIVSRGTGGSPWDGLAADSSPERLEYDASISALMKEEVGITLSL